MRIAHTDIIEWENGLGFTPCSAEYRRVWDAMRQIHDCTMSGANLDSLSPADYERYCRLDNELLTLQGNGHLGKSIRY